MDLAIEDAKVFKWDTQYWENKIKNKVAYQPRKSFLKM